MSPLPYTLARGLFGLNALIWLAIGITSLFNLQSGGRAVLVAVALLTLVNAGGMLFFARLLNPSRRWITLLGLVFLVVNIFLTVTDQFGWLDLLTMLLDAFLAGLLVYLLIQRP
jgi:hypothetical protein